MSQSYKTIYVNMRGKYTAAAPYNTSLNPLLDYTCIAIEDITGLLARGIDPYTTVYLPVGIPVSAFNIDDKADIPIFTFQSNTGIIVKIPGSYITGMPNADGVKYSNVMLGISLSAIPDDLDLTQIKADISDMISDRFGITSEVKSIVFGTPTTITQNDHLSIMAARESNITTNKSNLLKIAELTSLNDDLLKHIKQLEDNLILLTN